ncbi:MAG: LacI family DNA-binding transcriptional regulator [Ornithinimicrobium sp.]
MTQPTDSAAADPSVVGVKQVAAAAGVSLGTVSNVLNRPDVVSAATKARVEQAIRDLGFVRNESARQLRAGQSQVLAYLMLDAGNPFFTDVARGIEQTAQEHSLSLFLCNSNHSPQREQNYLSRLREQRVQGILITPVDPHSPALSEVSRSGIPLVILDRAGGEGHCSVSVDDVHGGRLALEHLLDLGHHRIAFVGGPESLGQVHDRRQGALAAVADHRGDGAAITEIPTASMTVAEGRSAGQRIAGIPRDRRPTAAFCANDLLALGLLQQCVTFGIRVPQDMAIVGYDDIEFAAAAAVPLTSVRQPRTDLGRTAARLLLDEANNREHAHQQIVFTPTIIVRQSTLGRG